MSRGIRALTPAVTAAVVLGLTAGPAAADDPFDVPADAIITLRGDGSGHGIGMSQYGAYGAANQGRDHHEILDFYYPGTQVGEAAGAVKVWVSGDDDRDLVVDDRDGLRIGRLGGRTWRPREPRATQWRVRPDRHGDNVVSFKTRTWHTWKVVSGAVEVAAGGKPLTLRTPDGKVRYRGALRSTALGTGQRLTVNVLPLEHYLRGVVPSEMQAGWPQQALRAQAVAARTYAVHERGDRNPTYDVCDTAACQAYGGASAEASSTTRAVTETRGEVLTYAGETALAMYSASNGGHTVSGEHGEPYLPAQPDPWEGTSPDYYDWRVRISARAIEREYHLNNLTAIRISSRDGLGPRGGRVRQLEVTTAGGEAPGTYPINDIDRFRVRFGLPSELFEITRVE